MSINAIRLRNFRGFRDETLHLKPLTVLLGPNSSGKSSFGHALAAMAHCQWLYGGGGQRATLTPTNDSDDWPIDLGGTKDLRTHGESGRVYVELLTDGGLLELGFGGSDPSEDNLRINYVSYPFSPGVSSGTKPPSDRPRDVIPEAESDVVRADIGPVSEPPSALALHRMNESIWWDENENVQASVDLEGLIIRSVKHLGHTLLPLNREVRDAVSSLFKNLAYLRATRRRPSRSYRDEVGARQAIGYAGEWTATILQERGPDPIVFFGPPRVPSTVEEARRGFDTGWEERRQSLVEAVGWWLQQLGLATSVESVRSLDDKRRLHIRVSLPGQQPHDITEIGFGVSQILPVLTAGLMQPGKSMFVVDLPEAHLHPWPQARLADFFCSLALSGRCALVETHSEMFFHRLRLRGEMNPELLDKIAVYFIDEPKDGKCSPPRPVGLSSSEQLKWPAGFLAEAWDTEKHIKIIREARRVRA
jgi:predicted ATPase